MRYLYKAASVSDVDLTPTEAMRAAARRGLEMRKKAPKSRKGGLDTKEAGRQGIGSGVARATSILRGGPLSEKTVRMMHRFFIRHAAFKHKHTSEPDGPAHQSWLLWGGDAGESWSARKVKELDNAREKVSKGTEMEDIKKAGRTVKYKHRKFAGFDSKGKKRYIYYYDDPKKNKGKTAHSEAEFLGAGVSKGDIFSVDGKQIEVLEVKGDLMDLDNEMVRYKDVDGKVKTKSSLDFRKDLLYAHKESIEAAIKEGIESRKAVLDAAKKRGNKKQIERAESLLNDWLERHGVSKDDLPDVLKETPGKGGIDNEKTIEDRPPAKDPKPPAEEYEPFVLPPPPQIPKKAQKQVTPPMVQEANKGKFPAPAEDKDKAVAKTLVEAAKKKIPKKTAQKAVQAVQEAYKERKSASEISKVAETALSKAEASADTEKPKKPAGKYDAIREKKTVPIGGAVAKKGSAWLEKSFDSLSSDFSEQAKSLGDDHYEAIATAMLSMQSFGAKDAIAWMGQAKNLEVSAALFGNSAKGQAKRDVAAWMRSTANAIVLGYEPLPLKHVVEQRKKEAEAAKNISKEAATEILASTGLNASPSVRENDLRALAFSMEALKGIGARHRLLEAGEGGGGEGMGQITLEVERVGGIEEGAAGVYRHAERSLVVTEDATGIEMLAHEMWHAMDYGFARTHGEEVGTASENLFLKSIKQKLDFLKQNGATEEDLNTLREKYSQENPFPEREEIRAFIGDIRGEVEKVTGAVKEKLVGRLSKSATPQQAEAAAQGYVDYLSESTEILARFGEQWTSYKVAEAQAQGRLSSNVSIVQPYATLVHPETSGNYLPHDVFMKYKEKFESTAFFKELQGTLEKALPMGGKMTRYIQKSVKVDTSALKKGPKVDPSKLKKKTLKEELAGMGDPEAIRKEAESIPDDLKDLLKKEDKGVEKGKMTIVHEAEEGEDTEIIERGAEEDEDEIESLDLIEGDAPVKPPKKKEGVKKGLYHEELEHALEIFRGTELYPDALIILGRIQRASAARKRLEAQREDVGFATKWQPYALGGKDTDEVSPEAREWDRLWKEEQVAKADLEELQAKLFEITAESMRAPIYKALSPYLKKAGAPSATPEPDPDEIEEQRKEAAEKKADEDPDDAEKAVDPKETEKGGCGSDTMKGGVPKEPQDDTSSLDGAKANEDVPPPKANEDKDPVQKQEKESDKPKA